MTRDEYNNLQAGDGVTYRPHPDAPAEDGEVTRLIRGISQLVHVRWLNGPQAAKTTTIHYALIEVKPR